MTNLTNLLKLSIEREAQKQALRTYNNLTEQLLETLKPSANCSPVVAMAMQIEREIWESAKAAGESALRGISAETAPVPMYTCLACTDQTPELIDGFCGTCDELFRASMACGLQARGVLQMKRRAQ